MSEPWTAARAREFFDYEAQPKAAAGVCDLCGRAGPFAGVASRDRYGFPVRTVQCWCGLVFQDPHLAPQGLRALYAGPYRRLVSAWHGRTINTETLAPEQAEYGRRLAASITPGGKLWDPRGRLLDLGGSTGVVARRVADCLYMGEVTVVEPSLEEAVSAIPRADNVIVQSAEDFEPEDDGTFDLILLCQTVDHLRSISAVLAKVRRWLAPGGRFFVDIVDWTVARGDGPAWHGLKIDHVYSLSPETMEAYLARHGFTWRRVEAPSAGHVAFLCEVA
jgi:SAM-dependent methyltransferase